MAVHAPTRRTILLGALCASPALLAGGCEGPEDNALIASAARNGNRQTFVDTVGWQEPNGRSLVVAFVPWLLSDRERADAIANRGVYPALSYERPLLEMRLDIDGVPQVQAGAGAPRITPETLRAIQFTFWFYDDPTPVIRIERDAWPSDPDVDVAGLDGELRRGGWVIGNIRARQLLKGSRNAEEAYLVNLKFIQSLA